jgi:Dehydrogenase E1 component
MANQPRTRVSSAAANGKMGHSLISEKKFHQLYDLALRLQLTGQRSDGEERAAKGLRGREAALAGALADLRETDVLVAENAASVGEILRGHCGARMGRRSFEERVIEALCDAVGDRMRKTGRITAIFLDGAEGSRILQEARALAIAARLPVLLVEHASMKRATSAKNRKKQTALEYPSIPVDTQDVIAMYRVAHEAIARARDGGGPTHVVGVRWQFAGKKKGVAKAEGVIEHLEHWLMARGLPAEEWRQKIVAEFEARGREPSFAAPPTLDGAIEDEDTETRAIA